MAERLKRLRVIPDEGSPTGHYAIFGDRKVPATSEQVRLWQMYIMSLELARRLYSELYKTEEKRNG